MFGIDVGLEATNTQIYDKSDSLPRPKPENHIVTDFFKIVHQSLLKSSYREAARFCFESCFFCVGETEKDRNSG